MRALKDMRAWNGRRLHWLAAAAWVLVALVVFWQYDPVHRKLDADASFMLYAGQQILRGHAPYVSVAIVKLPVSPFAAAAGIAVGRLFTPDDILSGRIAFWLCAGLVVGAVYFIGAQLATAAAGKVSPFVPILAGSFSAAVLLSFQTLGVQVAEGPEAKLPMVAAGFLSVVLIAHQKFFWAGFAAAMSFMAWQPGLVFVAAVLICCLLASDRKRALGASVAGVLLPVLVVGAYLASNGALGSMFRQAFGANANYLDEKKVAVGIFGVLFTNIGKVWEVSLDCSPTETPFIYLGYAGIAVGLVGLAYAWWRTRDRQLGLSAFPVCLSGAALFGFSFLDLQKCSDLVPLLPYLALGLTALFLIALVIAYRFHSRLGLALGSFLILLALIYGARDALALPRQNGLEQQRALANELAAQLSPAEPVQQFGDTVFLVMTRRENATRFVHLGEKQGLGILTAEGVTMQALVQQLQDVSPRLITLSRAKNKDWAKPVYDWIETNYMPGTSYGASEGGTLKDTDVWWRK